MNHYYLLLKTVVYLSLLTKSYLTKKKLNSKNPKSKRKTCLTLYSILVTYVAIFKVLWDNQLTMASFKADHVGPLYCLMQGLKLKGAQSPIAINLVGSLHEWLGFWKVNLVTILNFTHGYIIKKFNLLEWEPDLHVKKCLNYSFFLYPFF